MLVGIRSGRLPKQGRSAVSCLLCQWRSFASSSRRRVEQLPESKTSRPATDPTDPSGPLADAPRPYGKRTSSFTPTPLSRPIGMPRPPRVGENTGVDGRSLGQRKADFVDYDKHLVRRKELTDQIARPYFRDWNNLQFHDGKTFIAPPRLFRGDVSLYFPNLHGRTLLKTDRKPRDTTPALAGKASVVTVFSGMWAEGQAQTFVSPGNNPALHEVLVGSGGRAQLVQVNIEENALKAWLVRLFAGNLRRRVGKANWDKYFLVRRGISHDIRERIGLLNGKVGYTYLVDQDCRIRWAGSGASEAEERDGLVKGVRRLLDEMSKGAVQNRDVKKRPVSGSTTLSSS